MTAGLVAFYLIVSVGAGLLVELEIGDPWESSPRRAARGMTYVVVWPLVALLALVVVTTDSEFEGDDFWPDQ